MVDNPRQKELDPTSHSATIRAALETLCESEQFTNADRLKAFLTYVVEEAIAGRSDQILGKTIAQDVYLRNMTASGSRDNLVRVDAGRLRRKLTEFYDSTDAARGVRIHIDSGGYAPWFEDCSSPEPASVKSETKAVAKHWLWAGAGATMLVLSLGLFTLWSSGAPEEEPAASSRNTVLKALAAKSPATVQAENLCNNARALLFPVASVDNQKLASDIFRQAIKTDPEYACGYAGLGHSLSTTAILSPPGPAKTELQVAALQEARRAVDIAPTDGWSHSALAWANYANGNHEEALRNSALAEELAPSDGNVLDFRAVTLVILGHFQKSYEISHPDRPRVSGSYRFAHRNIHAVASFHLGKYLETITSINIASENGDPVSALSLVYLAAAHEGLGQRMLAREKLAQLRNSWPAFNAMRVVGAFYADPAHASEVLEKMHAAGWLDPA